MAITGVTLSGSLAGIVNSIRPKSYKYFAHEGVMKNLVTEVGVGKKGSSVVEPYLDPTSRAGTAAAEGTDFTAFTSYLPTTRTYTATEWAEGTIITYDDVDEATESMMDENARMHGAVHGKKIESKLVVCMASFTSGITATTTAGLTIGKIAAAKALLEGKTQSFTGPFNLVITPNVQYRLWENVANNSTFGTLGNLGDSFLDKYHVGTVLGDVRIFNTNAITAAATVKCGLFIKSAIALFSPRDYTFKTEENISYRGYELVSTHKAGGRVRLAAAGITITTTGSDPT